jgi:large subunit ribosomal protein L21
MYAVIETGGKQYRVELGMEIEVELLDAEPGQEINLERVLLVADGDTVSVGQPIVADAEVKAMVLRQDRGVKTISFKYRPKARSRVKKGHRQELLILKITDVRLGDKSAAAEAQDAADKAKEEHDRVNAAATRQAAEDASLAARLAKRVRGSEGAEEADASTAKPAKKAAKSSKTEAKAEDAAEPEAKAKAEEKPSKAGKPEKAKVEPKAEPKAEAKAKIKTEEPKAKAKAKAKADAKPAPGNDAPKKSARTKKDE